MRITLTLIASIIMLSACSQKPLFDQKAGNLRLAIDKAGKITTLKDISNDYNYIDPNEVSYLLECAKYREDNILELIPPESLEIIEKNEADTKIELSYKGGIKLIVKVTPKEGYFRMELMGADPVSEVSQIVWGPYKTTMRGQIAEWLGLNRSENFTIGLISFEPNTDGILQIAASYTDIGSQVQLTSYDQTRGRFVNALSNKALILRKSVPINDLTTVGSAVALFGCPSGRSNELGIIEKIEIAEGLPHPTFGGVWNKYSDEGQKFCIWAYYTEQNFDKYLALSKKLGARFLCRPGGYSGNWGHFDINRRIYPGGIPAMVEDNEKARKENIKLTLYTLTTFLKPNPDPEPYLTPIPDERLQIWKAETKLMKTILPDNTCILLKSGEDIVAALNEASDKVIRLDNEFIEFKSFTVDGNLIKICQCERGAFHTQPVIHQEQTRVTLMYVSGDHFYPGTLDLSNEISERLGNLLLETDLDNFVVDGFESCLETGYGNYTGNIFLENFYNKCVKNNKEVLVTGSFMSQYTWHMMSHISWGEGDQERGVRGTMLDYRISRQMELRRNLMPNKLGQYYPSKATDEDINWIMALATGWDAGVDFQLDIKEIEKNEELEKITETLRLWEQARADNAFSEKQKMELRQTDALYKLSKNTNGGWDLAFDRFWQNDKLHILPPSVMAALPVNGGPESVKPLSIDWKWTHNPGLYDEVGLSDDLVQRTGTRETSWTVTYPPFTENKKSWYPTTYRQFQFVIRLPEDAPGAVKNFNVTVNGKTIEIPVTLEPGQYISIPHLIEMACIYNKDHHVTEELYLHGNLPKVNKGEKVTVGLSCEPLDKNTNPEIIMNVRCQNGYYYHR